MASSKNFVNQISDGNSRVKVPKISVFSSNKNSQYIVSKMILKYFPAEICVFDEDQLNLDLYVADLKYFKSINQSLKFSCVTDIKKTENSDVCITCFSYKDQINFDMEVIFQNILLYEKYMPEIIKHSPNAILLIATHPYSIITFFCKKFTNFKENRLIGLGATDFSRLFRRLVSSYFEINTSEVKGWVSGHYKIVENNQLALCIHPLWSTVLIGGCRFGKAIDLSFEENFLYMNKVIDGLSQLNEIKFNTYYTTANVIYDMLLSILINRPSVYSISCNISGHYGVNSTVYIGLPCLVTQNGSELFINSNLTQNEIRELMQSATENHEITKFLEKKYKKFKQKQIAKLELNKEEEEKQILEEELNILCNIMQHTT